MLRISLWLAKLIANAIIRTDLISHLTKVVRDDVRAQLALMKMTPYQPMVVKTNLRAGEQCVINLSLGEIHGIGNANYAIDGPMACVKAIALRPFTRNQVVPINGTNLNDVACGFGAEPMYTLSSSAARFIE